VIIRAEQLGFKSTSVLFCR